MPPTQEYRPVAIDTTLGADVLLIKSFSISEQVGRLFQINVDMVSTNGNLDFNSIVGENATIRLELGQNQTRYFNGCVSRFVQTKQDRQFAHFQATLVPWLWFLTRTSDCRIFQEKKVPDIIEEIFGEAGFSDYELSLSGTYRVWPYCVQYRETDFNFISRLLEHEGIYYYFKHEDGKHTLVLADSISAHAAFENYAELPYRPPMDDVPDLECVTDWVVEKSVQPGTYALTDFNFEKPKTSLLAQSHIAREHTAADYEMFDFPGDYGVYGDGENYAKVRVEELQAQHEILHGQSMALGLCAGYLLTLKDHPRDDQNREYLILGTTLRVEGVEYESGSSGNSSEPFATCGFTAIDSQTPFRPRRVTPKPLIQGPQTAIVVGKSGEEIHTDEFGRVIVQFHWDRYGKMDENSSCWVRVAQQWAGKKWGSIYTPRIGQEVIVEFLEGDPDRPIITGRVYNGEAMPPYELPANKTMSTLKSNSSKGGTGFNEIRFEDKKGEEELFLHAEKNHEIRVKNDLHEWVGNEKHLIVVKDQFQTVEGSNNTHIKGDDLAAIDGDQGSLVQGDHLLKIDGSDHLEVGGDQMVKVTGDVNQKYSANLNQDVGQKISIKSGQDFHAKAGMNYGMDAGMEVHLKGGMKVIIEGGTQVSLKAGPSFIDLGPSGISISGPMVNVNSGGAAGSGSGSSPTAPVAAEAPDPPAEPVEAATADPGEVEEAPPAPEPPEPVTYSSAATVLQAAAVDGTPFCEECARAAAAAEEAEEVAAISKIAFLDGSDDKELSGEAIQWTNLPREDKWVDTANHVASIDRLGQKVRFKVKFSIPGAHPFKVRVVPGDDNQVYTDGEKGRNANFKFLEEEKSYTTDSDGTKIVESDFVTTCAGLDSYKLEAEDENNNPIIETGQLKTKRLIYAVVIKMKDMGSIASLGGMISEFRKHGIEIVELAPAEIERLANIGPDQENTYQQKCKAAFNGSAGKAKSPYAVAIGFTEHLAVKNPDQTLELTGVQAGPDEPPAEIDVQAPGMRDGDGLDLRPLWKDLVPDESWFVSAKFYPDDGSAGVNIPESSCTPLPEGSSDCDAIRVDVTGLPKKVGTIRLKVHVVDRMRVGLSFSVGNLICICTKAWWVTQSTANQVAVAIHEMGHKVHMVSDGSGKRPDKVETHYQGKGHIGHHCHHDLPVQGTYANVEGNKCVMFGDLAHDSPPQAFCEKCAPAVKKMDLSEGWTP